MLPRITERGRTEPLTSLVLPAYNPGRVIERTWFEVERFLHDAPGRWECLFVCDGCTDGTPSRLRELTNNDERCRVLSYEPNQGKGYAVRHGLEAARGDWRLFTDIDLAYGWDDVLRVARALWDGAEAVIASRTHQSSQARLPTSLLGYAYRRHLQGAVFGQIARLLLPISQHDTQAGLKGLTARAAWVILPHLRCDGFGFDCELLTACARYGFPVTEVPICVRFEDRASTTGLRSMGQMIGELWRIRQTWRNTPPALAIPVEVKRREAA
jgi:dolichyl-phosphate beta-glucosyltransferase